MGKVMGKIAGPSSPTSAPPGELLERIPEPVAASRCRTEANTEREGQPGCRMAWISAISNTCGRARGTDAASRIAPIWRWRVDRADGAAQALTLLGVDFDLSRPLTP